MKKLAFNILVFGFCNVYSQNICESSRENQNTLNVISIQKCLIPSSSSNETRNNSVNRSKRYLTVRNVKAHGIVQIANKLESNNVLLLTLIIDNNENRVFSFREVDNLPLFKKCKQVIEKKGERMCYNKEIKKHIYSNLAKSERVNDNYNSGLIDVKFNINEKGKVKDVNVFGNNKLEAIKAEVKNIINKLPRFTPAKKEGQNVTVSYDFKIDIRY